MQVFFGKGRQSVKSAAYIAVPIVIVSSNFMLRNICAPKQSHVLILGDFNFKEVNWAAFSVVMGMKHTQHTMS